MRDKNLIRTEIRKRRDLLSNLAREEKSEKIMKYFFELNDYKSAEKIMCYISFSSEVNTFPMLKRIISDKGSVWVPVIRGNDILAVRIKSLYGLRKNKFGILEPSHARREKEVYFDIIVVPGIAFDKKGNRIGFGKGYYDRFLNKIPAKRKIALCFDFQILPKLPTSESDQKVEKIITEKGVIVCR